MAVRILRNKPPYEMKQGFDHLYIVSGLPESVSTATSCSSSTLHFAADTISLTRDYARDTAHQAGHTVRPAARSISWSPTNRRALFGCASEDIFCALRVCPGSCHRYYNFVSCRCGTQDYVYYTPPLEREVPGAVQVFLTLLERLAMEVRWLRDTTGLT